MATEVIEKSCLAIIKELKHGQFTLAELRFLESFFKKVANMTKEKILS